MFRIQLKLIIREFFKDRVTSALIIAGMAIGLASFILIFQFIVNEVSFDRFLNRSDRIYRVICDLEVGNTILNAPASPFPMAKTLVDHYPEVEMATRLDEKRMTIGYDHNYFNEDKIAAVDPNFLDFFSFKLLKGNKMSVLKTPYSMLITEKMAKKYFGDKDPVNQSMEIIYHNKKYNFKVTGVLEDFPKNSSINYDFLLSMSSFPEDRNDGWENLDYNTFLLLKKGVPQSSIDNKFPSLVKKYIGNNSPNFDKWLASGNKYRFYLQPLDKIHLDSNFEADYATNSSKMVVYILGIIALLIITVSSVNYINLSNIRLSQYSKESGLLKIFGARSKQLFIHNISLSILTCFISLGLAIAIVIGISPYFHRILGIQQVKYLNDFRYIFLIFLTTLLIGFVSGLLPAINIYSKSPARLMNRDNNANGKLKNRSFWVIFQNAISICLVIVSLIIIKQSKLLENKNLGFNKSNILTIENAGTIKNNLSVFKEQLMQNPNILDVSVSGYIPGSEVANYYTLNTSDGVKKEQFSVHSFAADEQFLKTYDIPLAEGRFFRQDDVSKNECVLNNKAIKQFKIKEPLGKTIIYNKKEYTIVGIIRDVNYESLYYGVKPLIITQYDSSTDYSYISIKCRPGNKESTIKYIGKTWKELTGNMPFQYSFLDQKINTSYKKIQVFSRLVAIFTVLSILIACLGILGLSFFMAQRRTKEIGIRKVNGARIVEILTMLSKDFVKWIVLAFLLACPIAWYAMHRWLENFAYKTTLSWWIFVLAGVIALAVALLTMSFQSWKAATRNPVEALRYE